MEILRQLGIRDRITNSSRRDRGLLGFTATFFSAEIVVWLVRVFRENAHPVFLAGIASWCLIYAIVWLVHLLVGTPETVMNVLPGMIAGAFFSFG